MKEVLILRHGKSDWNAGAANDHERPLNPRGERAADKIGRFLAATGRRPDLIVSSTAVRARTTAQRAIAAGSLGCTLLLDGSLYGASVSDVLETLRKTQPDIQRLLIAGHEPTSSATVAHLTGANVRFPTAALACISLPIANWQAIDPARRLSGELQWFVIPRLLEP